MKNLPNTTEINKKIPKTKFYENITISSALKKIFVEQIKSILWLNKISDKTTNLEAGENVSEIEIFEIKLNGETLDKKVLQQIDKEIPYHIIFLLTKDDSCQMCTAYKEKTSSGKNAFKVGRYYQTPWIKLEEIVLNIEGLNTDKVYENFVRQIAGDVLNSAVKNESLEETIARDEKKRELQRQIDALESKIRKEKQFNKQVEMNSKLRQLKKEIEEC